MHGYARDGYGPDVFSNFRYERSWKDEGSRVPRAEGCAYWKYLNTYPGELAEKDLSSPIISMAVRKGIIEKEELGDLSVLPRLSKLEGIYKKKAQSYIQIVSTHEKKISSVNIRGFSDFLTKLMDRFSDSRSLR